MYASLPIKFACVLFPAEVFPKQHAEFFLMFNRRTCYNAMDGWQCMLTQGAGVAGSNGKTQYEA